MKRILKIGIGWMFLILGILGFFLPILQGFLFTAIGLFFLAEESHFIRKYLNRLEQRYPEQLRKAHEFRESLHKKFQKFIHRNNE